MMRGGDMQMPRCRLVKRNRMHGWSHMMSRLDKGALRGMNGHCMDRGRCPSEWCLDGYREGCIGMPRSRYG